MKLITLFLGDQRTLRITINEDDGTPKDLTAATGVTARFPKADGDFLEKTLGEAGVSIVEPKLGEIDVDLSADEISDMRVDEYETYYVVVTIGSEIRTFEFLRGLTVKRP